MNAPLPAGGSAAVNEDQHNAFTFLRQILALIVVVAHAYPLGGFGFDPFLAVTSGEAHAGVVAVMCFFVASGYMITQSLQRHPSLIRFTVHRAARILPGFYVNLCLTVFLLVPALAWITGAWQSSYWAVLSHGQHSPLRYLVANAHVDIVAYEISGFAIAAPMAEKVNGSLWSLWPELICYFYTALLAAFRLLHWRWVTLFLFTMAYAFHCFATKRPDDLVWVFVQSENFGLVLGDRIYRAAYLAFLAGIVCRQWKERLPRRHLVAFLGLAVLLGASLLGYWSYVWPLTLPWLVIYLAWSLPFRAWERYGDFSYGIYIYSFPLQQCLAALGAHHLGLFVFIILSLVVSVVAGAASWYLVENPCLRWVRAKVDRSFPKPVPITA